MGSASSLLRPYFLRFVFFVIPVCLGIAVFLRVNHRLLELLSVAVEIDEQIDSNERKP